MIGNLVIILTLVVTALIIIVGFLCVKVSAVEKRLINTKSDLHKLNLRTNGLRSQFYQTEVDKLNKKHKKDLELLSAYHADNIKFVVDLNEYYGYIIKGKKTWHTIMGSSEGYKLSPNYLKNEVDTIKKIQEKLCCKKGKK